MPVISEVLSESARSAFSSKTDDISNGKRKARLCRARRRRILNLLQNSLPIVSIFGYKKRPERDSLFSLLVGVTGFEPTTSWSRTKRATSCATPRNICSRKGNCTVWCG